MVLSARKHVDSPRSDFRMMAALDCAVALGLLLCTPHHTASHIFDPAKALLPIRVYGALLLGLVIVKVVVMRYNPAALPWVSLLLAANWTWWFIVFAIYFIQGDGSPFSTPLACVAAYRHYKLFATALRARC